MVVRIELNLIDTQLCHINIALFLDLFGVMKPKTSYLSAFSGGQSYAPGGIRTHFLFWDVLTGNPPEFPKVDFEILSRYFLPLFRASLHILPINCANHWIILVVSFVGLTCRRTWRIQGDCRPCTA